MSKSSTAKKIHTPKKTTVDTTSIHSVNSKKEPSAEITQNLADVVTLTRQFQRAVTLDQDYGNPEALKGYICQGTARNVLDGTAKQIINSSQRAFTWTGPFGGGKSSLALALCSLVTPNKKLRNTAYDLLGIKDSKSCETDISKAFATTTEGWLVLPIVGFRGSIVDELARCLDNHARTNILEQTKSSTRTRTIAVLQTLSEQAEKRPGNGLLLVIDELGKFLEASANDGDDIYFFQELYDTASRSKEKIVIVGILHQSFDQYANRLNSELRDEWRKIQGRYIDIPLVAASDEMVELTGKAIHTSHEHPESLIIANQIAAAIRHRRPGLSSTFAESLDRCWPLHPITAALLGPASRRRFGQNERSAFGFLASVEPRSFREFLNTTALNKKITYTPADYWDYLRINLEPSIMASPDGHRWAQGVDAVERTETKQRDDELHVKIVKTIALIELFRSGSGLLADEGTLLTCLHDSSGKLVSVDQLQLALKDLQRWAIIIYKRHQASWALTEGSDFDLDSALDKELASIDEPDLKQLSELVKLQPILAKRHYCETGNLRWMLPYLAHPNNIYNQDTNSIATDKKRGKNNASSSAFGSFCIVLPARNKNIQQTVESIRLQADTSVTSPILVGVAVNGENIRELGRELVAYEKIRRTTSELENDSVARRELIIRITDVRTRLQDQLRDALVNIKWLNCDRLSIKQPAESDKTLSLAQITSQLADNLFSLSPQIFSELINRDTPSSNGAKARRDLMYSMLRHESKERLGFEGYPAEAGLYHNILEASGIHGLVEKPVLGSPPRFGFRPPTEDNPAAKRANSFKGFWAVAEKLISSDQSTTSLPTLFEIWQGPNFGIRPGVLPVLWFAFYLANKHRMAMYKDGMFLSEVTEVNIDEMLQSADRFTFKNVAIDEFKLEILRGISKHLKYLGTPTQADPLQIARKLVSIVFELPQWTYRTANLSSKTKLVRDTLIKASDPHKVLFVDLPLLLKTTDSSGYLKELTKALAELFDAYPKMINDVVRRTLSSLDASMENDQAIKMLHERSKTVSGISGNLQLEAFALHLSTITSDTKSIEGLLSLSLNKSPREWNDRDINAALIQLAEWALRFRQIETVSSIQGRPPTRNAIAVVFGTGESGKTVTESFDISPEDTTHIRELSELIILSAQGVRREVVLAALAQAGTLLVEMEDVSRSNNNE